MMLYINNLMYSVNHLVYTTNNKEGKQTHNAITIPVLDLGEKEGGGGGGRSSLIINPKLTCNIDYTYKLNDYTTYITEHLCLCCKLLVCFLIQTNKVWFFSLTN